MKYKYWYLLLIVVLGFVLRFVQVNNYPVSMYWDEAAIGYDAYAISHTGRDMHGKPWYQAILLSYGDYKAPVYVWLSALVMQLVEPSVMAVRLPSVIVGTLLIAVVYLVAKELFDNELISLFSALFVAISPWGIHFSRIAFEANIGMLLVAISLWLLLYGLKKPAMMSLAGLVAGLSVYAYFSARIVVVLMAVGVLVVFWKSLTKKHIPWLVAGGIIFALTMIPLYKSLLYEASQQYRLSTPSLLGDTGYIEESSRARELSGDSIVSRLVYHRYIYLAEQFGRHVLAHFHPDYLFFYGDPNLRHSSQQAGIIWLVSLPVLILGIYFGIKKYLKAMLLIAWLWLIFILPAAIPFEIPHALRSLNALPLTGLVLGLGMYALMKMEWGKIYSGILGLALVISLGLYLHDYFVHYPNRSAQSFQYGYEQVSRVIGNLESDFDSIRFDEFDRLYPYVLFFTRFNPEQLAGAELVNDGAVSFGKYRFGKINSNELSTVTESDLLVLNYGSAQQFTSIEPLEIISDRQGEPMFYIYSGDRLNYE